MCVAYVNAHVIPIYGIYVCVMYSNTDMSAIVEVARHSNMQMKENVILPHGHLIYSKHAGAE